MSAASTFMTDDALDRAEVAELERENREAAADLYTHEWLSALIREAGAAYSNAEQFLTNNPTAVMLPPHEARRVREMWAQASF